MSATSQTTHLGVIRDKISFISKLGDLNHATSDDATPTPGYLYQQIAQWTLDSGSFCQDTVDYLSDRLSSKSCHVKLKTLRIMRHIIGNGHPEFRQALRKYSHGIKEATKFNGPPDPLHGNAPYLMIRKEAKELSQVLFDESTHQMVSPSPALRSGATGLGSSAISGTMQGFGNTPVRPKSLGENLMSGLSRLIDTEPTKQPPARGTSSQAFSQYTPASLDQVDNMLDNQLTAGTLPSVNQQRQAVIHSAQRKHRPGLAGGGWEDPEDDDITPVVESASNLQPTSRSSTGTGPGSDSSGSNVAVQRGSEDRVPDHMSDGTASLATPIMTETVDQTSYSDSTSGNGDSTSTGVEDYAAEKKLIQTVITSETAISSKQASDFLRKCCELNCEAVVQQIAENLQAERQHTTLLRLMLLLEALLRTDIISPDLICQQCSTVLLDIVSKSDGPPKTKAHKILRIVQKLCPKAETALFSMLPRAPTNMVGSIALNTNHSSVSDGVSDHTDNPLNHTNTGLLVEFSPLDQLPHTFGNSTQKSAYNFINSSVVAVNKCNGSQQESSSQTPVDKMVVLENSSVSPQT